MYLKRLEIQGFKSFPDKTVLEFGGGITAVVGPNGSGKSNISDAIRWALGEQSARNLRGGKMEDVIFAGTTARRALGFAEVTLVLDNTDGSLKIDYQEAAVTRRVYRSGESEYLINGAACRLKDVHELFMDTGIGREGYSIIGQGRIDEILSVKSDERRLLFEEAAGIVKYKSRRREAETRLERERENLSRVDDILSELTERLEPLERASEKARRFLKVGERLKNVRVAVFLRETEKFGEDVDSRKKNIGLVEEQINAARSERAEEIAAAEEISDKVGETERAIELISERAQNKKSEIDKTEGEIELAEQAASHIDADKTRLSAEIAKKRSKIEENEEFAQTLKTEAEKLVAERGEREGEYAAKEAEYNAFGAEVEAGESLSEKFAAEHIGKLKASNEIGEKIAREEAVYEQLEQRKEELSESRAEAESQKAESEKKCADIAAELSALRDKREFLRKATEDLLSDRAEFDAKISAADAALRAKSREIGDAESRRKLLSELETNHEGYYKSVKSILNEKARNPAFSGICGAVGELLTVPDDLSVAVEVALGGGIQDVVTETEDDAHKAIEFLKRTKDGRATFLPISTVSPRNFSERGLLNERGVLGLAKELVKYGAKYENVISSLLGQTIVFDNFDAAVAFSRKYKYRHRCVTLEGELITPGGAISGGSSNKSAVGILSRSGEIARIAAALERSRAEYAEMKAEADEVIQKRDAIRDIINRNRVALQESELSTVAKNAELLNETARKNDLAVKSAEMASEERNVDGRLIDRNKLLRALKGDRDVLNGEIADVLKLISERSAELAEKRKAKEKMSRALSSLKVAITEAAQKIKKTEADIARVFAESNALAAETAKDEGELEKKDAEKAEKSAVAEGLRLALERLSAELERIGEERREAAELRARLSAELKAAEAATLGKLEALSGLENEKTRLEMQLEQAEAESRRLYDEMWEEYGITRQAALAYEEIPETTAKLKREERDLKDEIRAMGDVNVGALEEFKQVSERRDFMSKQRSDVAEAEKSLAEMITDLNKMMSERFNEQIALISENFNAVFSKMFGGGEAKIVLDGEALDGGIEIEAKMPGKNLRSMSLFSGGERALTAIALLFGILRMKPSPFCVLDEIDAALDDANAKRYADFLEDFAATQFIIVTHRKVTMEAAKILYGVTMQEHGVSKIVNVKF